jgi:hypothetical protein
MMKNMTSNHQLMESTMPNDLQTKATALLEAHRKLPGKYSHQRIDGEKVHISRYDERFHHSFAIANTHSEVIAKPICLTMNNA